MVTKRIDWVDVAKGIGMLLVIAGHTFQLRWSSPIYAFHLPLFFFLSGLFAISAYDNRFLDYVKKLAKRLILPWIVILAISFFVCLLVPSWRSQLTLGAIMRDLYSVNTNVFQNSSIWFLPCMFCALLMFRLTKPVSKYSGVVKLFGLLIVAFVLLIILPRIKSLPLPGGRLPFKLDSACLAAVFIAFAAWCRGGVEAFLNRFSRPLIAIALSSVTLCATNWNGWSNMNSLDFGVCKGLYFPIAFIGIGSVCCISRLISDNPRLRCLKSALLFYGKNSLLIFGFQSLFLRLYLLIANEVFGLDMHLYAANPVQHQILSFVLISFVASPMLVFGWKSCKEVLK